MISLSAKEVKELRKRLGYKGCRNCAHQIEPLRACQWLEHGGDGVLHFICPKWERRDDQAEPKKGEWIVKTDCEGKTRTCICRLCGYTTDKYTWKNPNYCQECGADMREIEK